MHFSDATQTTRVQTLHLAGSAETNPYLTNLPFRPLRINPDIVSEEAKRSAGESFGARAGLVITTLAMIAQGVLAFLLFNVFLRSIHIDSATREFIIWTLGLAVGIFSVIGKVAIVSFYNTPTFKEMGKNLEKYFESPSQYLNNRPHASISSQLKALIDLPWTINISLIFGIYITYLGFKSIETLLVTNYNHPFLVTTAHVMGNLVFMLPFMVASTYCNILGFPWIHSGGINRIKNFFGFLLENPEYRRLKTNQLRAIEVISKEWANVLESQNSNKIVPFLNRFFDSTLSNNDAININAVKTLKPNIENILRFARSSMNSAPPETWKEFFITRGLALTAAGFTASGLYNFQAMGVGLAQLLHIPTAFLQQSIGYASFISMALMALDSVYEPTKDFLAYALFERDYQYHALSWGTRFPLATILFVGMWLGGFPNGYQQYTLGGAVFPIINALFASAMIEVYPIYFLVKRKLENHVLRNDPTAHIGKLISDILADEIKNIPNLSEAELKHRAEILESGRNDIQSIRPTRRISDLISCCGLLAAPSRERNVLPINIEDETNDCSPLLSQGS